MNANRLRPQELVAGLGGLVLFAALFLPWVDATCAANVAVCASSVSGWNSLAVIDLILAVTAIGALALPIVAAMNSKPDAPITGDALVTLMGMISTLLVLFRLIDPVGDGGRGAGLYLAFVAALAISASAWSAMADEGSGPPTVRSPAGS